MRFFMLMSILATTGAYNSAPHVSKPMAALFSNRNPTRAFGLSRCHSAMTSNMNTSQPQCDSRLERRPIQTNDKNDIEFRLAVCERRLATLTRVVEGVAGALVHADDMALREREVLSVMPVLLHDDGDGPPIEHHRKVMLLRRSVQDVMDKNGMTPTPLERRWWKHVENGA